MIQKKKKRVDGLEKKVTENVNGNLNGKLKDGVNPGGTPVCLYVF